MLLLALPALIIGVASSLVLLLVMKVAAVLQLILWNGLPYRLGLTPDSPFWVIMMLTLTGLAVGLVIRYSAGHGGPDPATEPLIGAPVHVSALPGLLVALVLGLAGGVSLGPEHPIMVLNIALAVALVENCSRALPLSTGLFSPLPEPLAHCLAPRGSRADFLPDTEFKY
jgi:H+/Cl- antiporter ClcA